MLLPIEGKRGAEKEGGKACALIGTPKGWVARERRPRRPFLIAFSSPCTFNVAQAVAVGGGSNAARRMARYSRPDCCSPLRHRKFHISQPPKLVHLQLAD